ncbi:hypothetical protein GCM10009544_40030 [Streptomyces stramineus]|uniref:Uncharacterized protein n=1 Tax=Streptomyces stramineus TaxID=173861 RepID=A0ABN1ADV9_9ACTN
MVEEHAAVPALRGDVGGHMDQQAFLLMRGKLHASHLTDEPRSPGEHSGDTPEFYTLLTWGSPPTAWDCRLERNLFQRVN